RLALLAYPPAYRRERGAEILATLDEAGGAGAAEVWSLIRSGIRERGMRATGGSMAAAWRSGCRLAALALLLVTGFANLEPQLGVGSAPRWMLAAALPLGAAALVCLGRHRLALVLPAISAALFLHGSLFFGMQIGQSWPADQQWFASAYRVAD